MRDHPRIDVASLLMAAISTCWCVWAGWQLGATFDEPFYISQGLNAWRTGSQRELLRVGTMPLPVNVATLPHYLVERSTGRVFDAAAELSDILPWARMTTLLFWWLTLLYAWRIGHDLAGRRGATLAVLLLACEPNMLAHSCLATTDIALLGCLLAFAFHFRIGREADWTRRVLVPGCWFAAAVLAKASGLVYGVLLLWIIEAERLLRAGTLSFAACRRFQRDTCGIVLLGLLGVFLYCGSDWETHPSFISWAHSLPDGGMKSAVVWLAENLCVFSNAGVALVRQVKHNVQGHGVFIAGDVHARALWYYFPLLLCIKLPLSLLAAPLLALCRKRAWAGNWALLAAGLLLLASVTFRVQIGIRLVLPVVALGVIGTAVALAQAYPGRVRIVGIATALTLWSVLALARVGPHALCYTNELWGATSDGYLYVSDANYDWGQGLLELDAWRQRQGLRSLAVSYFGTDPRLESLPLDRIQLHLIKEEMELLTQVRGRCLAVSTTHLYGAYLPAIHPSIAYLRKQQPCGRTQTYLIYDLKRK